MVSILCVIFLVNRFILKKKERKKHTGALLEALGFLERSGEQRVEGSLVFPADPMSWSGASALSSCTRVLARVSYQTSWFPRPRLPSLCKAVPELGMGMAGTCFFCPQDGWVSPSWHTGGCELREGQTQSLFGSTGDQIWHTAFTRQSPCLGFRCHTWYQLILLQAWLVPRTGLSFEVLFLLPELGGHFLLLVLNTELPKHLPVQ